MKKWTPKHVNWLKALKIAAGAVAAILLAEAFGLQNAASAGIITLLTVQNTRRETVMSSVRRFSGFAMMTLLCLPIYHFCGTAPWAFGIVLLLLLLICYSFRMDDATPINAVMATHYMLAGGVTLHMVGNEVLLLVIGSGIGGGTLSGLSELITGVHQYALIRKLCQDGDLSQIDLTIGDMSKGKVGTLPPEATAANFAKLAEDATSADKMRGLVNLVLQAIGTMSVLACRTCGTNTVVLTGALTMLPPAHETFELFTQLYGVEYIIPENATFATAIGAALYSMREDG